MCGCPFFLAGKLMVNGYGVFENTVYPTTAEGSMISYPYEVPKDTEVTITEKNAREYRASVQVDDGEPEEVMSKTVTMDADKTIEFINTKKGVIPTGVWMSYTALILLGVMALIGVIFFSKKRTRRQ